MVTPSSRLAQAETTRPVDPEITTVEAQLAALDLLDYAQIAASSMASVTPAAVDDIGDLALWPSELGLDPNDAADQNFVKPETPERIQSNEFFRLVRQGVAVDEASRRAHELVRPLLVRERATQLSSPSPLPGSIADRAQAALRGRRSARGPRRPAGRHFIDENDGVDWFKALAAIPGREVWRFDTLLSKRRQREAYD